MPEPIEFQILQNLQTALLAIAENDGYHYDVVDSAVKLDPNGDVEALIAPDGPRPFVILQVDPEDWQYFPAREIELRMPVTVHWVSDSTPTDDKSRLQTFFRGCADVERAIAQDITRGGRAFDTTMTRRTLDLAVDGAQVWARIELAINVHRTFGQPDA